MGKVSDDERAEQAAGRPEAGRFTVLDGMILIAATGVGIAWTRAYFEGHLRPTWNARGALPQRHALNAVLAALPLLACWSVGLFACQLRGGRWQVAETIRRASTLAPVVISALLLAELTLMLLVRGIGLAIPNWDANFRLAQPSALSYLLAFRLAGAGLIVGLARIIRACFPPSVGPVDWIDRLGLVAEAAWILVSVAAIGIFDSLMI